MARGMKRWLPAPVRALLRRWRSGHFDYRAAYRRVDSGPYVGPAQSGAKLTEKAAREDLKRRGQQLQNEVKDGAANGNSGKPVTNSLEE